MTISELKSDAKIKLSRKWGLAITINIIHFLLNVILSKLFELVTVEPYATILSITLNIILLPFSYGLLVSMIQLYRDENTGLMDFVTIGLKNITRLFKLYLWMILKLWLPILLFIISITLLLFGIYSIISSNITSEILLIALIVSAITLVAGTFIYVIKILSYALSLYLLNDNPEATSIDILNKSTELMKGHRTKIVLIELSFLGWYILFFGVSILLTSINDILGTVALSIGILILEPYVKFTLIAFYENLAGISNIKSTDDKTVVE